jgi:glutaredoxin
MVALPIVIPPIVIQVYRWAGKWGPFQINIPCGECSLTKDIIDVVKDSRALYEMLARVRPIVGPKAPITAPSIWIDGYYVGGASDLSNRLKVKVEPNLDRGQCSLSLFR